MSQQQSADHGARQGCVLPFTGGADHQSSRRSLRRRHQYLGGSRARHRSKPRRPTFRAAARRAKVTRRSSLPDATPTAMIAPISDGTLRVVPVSNSMVRIPAERRRQSQDDHEGVAESLVVHDHQQIDKYRREQQPETDIGKRLVHRLDLADDLDGVAGFSRDASWRRWR